MELKKLYVNRFDEKTRLKKIKIWQVLCKDFFQKYISKEATVIDIAAGYCEFINNIECKKKYAIDLNEDTAIAAEDNVQVIKTLSTDLSFLDYDTIDVAFLSNFLEHLEDKKDIFKTLSEIYKVLKTEGKVIILQPNIRYCYKNYWDFFDHHTPISDRSLVEVLTNVGFKVEKVIPQFLPYTTKSKIPQSAWLVKMYLKMPFAWKLLGQQALVIAKK